MLAVMFLLFILLVPLVLIIIGIVFLCKSNPDSKKKGIFLILGGFLVFLVEILIGYSICSGMNFH